MPPSIDSDSQGKLDYFWKKMDGLGMHNLNMHSGDEDVEELLAEVTDENLLSLDIGAHRTNQAWAGEVPQLSTSELQKNSAEDSRGLSPELASRVAQLRHPESTPSADEDGKAEAKINGESKGRNQPGAPTSRTSASATGQPPAAADPADVDVLGAELAARLQALRGPSRRLPPAAPASIPIAGFPMTKTSGAAPGKAFATSPKQAPSGRAKDAGPDEAVVNSGDASKASNDTSIPREVQPSATKAHQSSSRSFWGKGRRVMGLDGSLPSTFTAANAQGTSRAGAAAEDREVNELLASISDEVHMNKQSSMTMSHVSGSGYLTEDEPGTGSELSEPVPEQEVEELVAWAQDAAVLEGNGQETTGATVRPQREGHLEGDQEEDNHGYWQDDEDGGSPGEGGRPPAVTGKRR